MSKILIDTNILVYGIDEDSAFFKRARMIFEQEKNQIISIGLAHGVHEVATFNTKDFKYVKEISLTEI